MNQLDTPGTGRHFRALGKDVLTYGLMAAVSQMSGLLLLPLLTRALSVDQYGTVDIITTFVSLITISMNLAMSNALSRYYKEVSGRQELSDLSSTLLLFVAGFGLLVTLAILPFASLISKLLLNSVAYGAFIWLGCWIAWLRSVASMPQAALRMERRILAYNVPNIVSTVIYVALALFFVFVLHAGVLGILVAQASSAALLLFVSLALTRRYLAPDFSKGHLRRALRFGLPQLPSLLSVWVNQQADRLILLAFVGLSGVALFGAAGRIAVVVTFLMSIFQLAWTPQAMIIIKEGERDDVYRRTFKYYAGGFAVLGLALTAISPEVFRLILPAEYHRAYVVIPWVIGAAVLHDTSMFTRLGMLVSEKTAGISIASWIAVALNVGIAIVLIKAFGFTGAAIGFFVAELVFTALLWRFSAQRVDIHFDTRSTLGVLLTYVIASIAVLVAAQAMTGAVSLASRVGVLLAAAVLIGFLTLDGLARSYLSSIPGRLTMALRRPG